VTSSRYVDHGDAAGTDIGGEGVADLPGPVLGDPTEPREMGTPSWRCAGGPCRSRCLGESLGSACLRMLALGSDPMIWSIAMVDELAGVDGSEEVEIDQIVERLGWTPRERLRYLLDMLAFEERAHRARPIPTRS
jgi:hypothetical protein